MTKSRSLLFQTYIRISLHHGLLSVLIQGLDTVEIPANVSNLLVSFSWSCEGMSKPSYAP
jgi:hypothetical protein